VAILGNGLRVAVLHNPQAPVTTTALWYRAGAADDPPGRAGLAHFLEHLMYKGSGRYGPGEVDRRTQLLGGTNNAFTTHDATAYYFNLASDRWAEALAIEADRMRGLTLDPGEVENERRVILEEIAHYEDDPWDALEARVQAALYGSHPYGRPVLGFPEELQAISREDLAGWHAERYRPDNAVLVVAGDVGPEALDAAAAHFGEVTGGAAPRAPLPPRPASGPVRLRRRQGEVARFLGALPVPAATHPDFAGLRLLAGVLGGGRASRLHRALVEEGQLCAGVGVDLLESQGAGFLALSLELVPGTRPARAEAALRSELAALRAAPPDAEELERAKRILLADWIFGHERVHQQALTVGLALALFDLDYPERQLAAALEVSAERLHELAGRYLDPDRDGVLGWSLPERGRRRRVEGRA
jgi:zinc protease